MSTERNLWADWPAPQNVKALVTTRNGGLSTGGFTSFNLGVASGDHPPTVHANRQLLQQDLAITPLWLQQVHGVSVAEAASAVQGIEADAAVGRQPGVACAVLTADCLPVLLCDLAGTTVAAVHAGWRGLANGVLEATVQSMGIPGESIMAWFGPAISSEHFEVGPEVREQFLARDSDAAQAFILGVGDRWFASLYTLARQRLEHLGIQRIYGGKYCSYAQPELFYSYRRDGAHSGRMASLIWLEE